MYRCMIRGRKIVSDERMAADKDCWRLIDRPSNFDIDRYTNNCYGVR
jgi:hypothetical protein